MKQFSKYIAFILGVALSFSACKKDAPIEQKKPKIQLSEVGNQSGECTLNKDLHIAGTIESSNGIQHLEIKLVSHLGSIEYFFDTKKIMTKLKGRKLPPQSAIPHVHLDLPKDVNAGIYDFVVTVTDDRGLKSDEVRKILTIKEDNTVPIQANSHHEGNSPLHLTNSTEDLFTTFELGSGKFLQDQNIHYVTRSDKDVHVGIKMDKNIWANFSSLHFEFKDENDSTVPFEYRNSRQNRISYERELSSDDLCIHLHLALHKKDCTYVINLKKNDGSSQVIRKTLRIVSEFDPSQHTTYSNHH